MARLLRRPGFVRYSATVAAVRATGTMFNVAGVLLVLERTHDLALAGVVAAAASLPGAITGPFLGGWLDVIKSRRRLLVLDRLLTALALAAFLLLAGHAPNWSLPLVAVLYGIASPLSEGAFSAAVPEVAGPELLAVANAFRHASRLGCAVRPRRGRHPGGSVGPGTVGRRSTAGTAYWCVGQRARLTRRTLAPDQPRRTASSPTATPPPSRRRSRARARSCPAATRTRPSRPRPARTASRRR
jgi:hypothetical protein